ncbi:MAG: hypothetical protein PWQ42_456 [Sulfurospirillum sp.]|jgi:quinol monooxygenase YgiN|nr:hypothetical protein [Sulfurospirillum sp.]DAB33921.1 MAG TPA: antibiotic biosynthesis monooxygenase [Sulfurospirillum sp. UBA12182]
MSVAVVATLRAKDAYVSELAALTAKLHDMTHKVDEGFLRYDLYSQSSDKNAFIFLESWESQEALEKHLNALHVKEFQAKIEHMIEDSEIKITDI